MFPAEAGAASVRVLNVFAPRMLLPTAVVDEKLTLLNVSPAPASRVTLLAPEIFIVDVPALNVRFEPV